MLTATQWSSWLITFDIYSSLHIHKLINNVCFWHFDGPGSLQNQQEIFKGFKKVPLFYQGT